MKLKYFSLFLLFLLGMHTAIAQGSDCKLPAPESLVNTVNDPTFVAFTFSPVQGATGYQVSIIYPSGAPRYTFELRDPNASSFSATVLNQSKTVRIAAMIGNCVSTSYTESGVLDKIIIMDLVAGLAPQDNLGNIQCTETGLNSTDQISCMVSSALNAFCILEFTQMNDTLLLKLTNTKTTDGSKDKIIVQLNNNSWANWKLSDKCNVKPFGVCDNSDYVYAEKKYNYPNDNPLALHIRGNGVGNETSISVAITGNTPATSYNVKVYDNSPDQPINPHSDNQTNQSSNEYKVTPNPFSDHLNITIDTPEKGEVVVNLFDVTGSLRKTVTLPANELDNQNYTIATSDLLAGMYIMQVRTSAGVQQVSKVFKL
jgi:Secretion system C-terminal sorting domain